MRCPVLLITGRDGNRRGARAAYFEVNVLGTILDRFQLSEPTGAYTSQLATATQIDGTLNDESDEDTGFVTEIAIPFGSFVDTAPNAPPRAGDTWRLNLYHDGTAHERC